MNLRKTLSNALGWKTKRKIVVFESDDWGSVRTRSQRDYKFMLAKGLNVDKTFFTRYDSLESNDDLERLFNLLLDFKDSTNRSPVFTPMCIVANPDFKKIKESGYSKYSYRNLKATVEEYPNHDKLLKYWRNGASQRLFVPALHGREHLNVGRYIKGLQDESNEGLRIALAHDSVGASSWNGQNIIEYLGAFHPSTKGEIEELEAIMTKAMQLFEDACGYSPTHFIGPNREPTKELDQVLARGGVKYLTQSKLRRYPKGDDKYGFEFNWLGKKNAYQQTYIMRNSGFEPSGGVHTVETCLSEIDTAFKWNKPAVISSHRANYIGSINEKNSDFGLSELKRLLKETLRRWPEVEFMTSTDLGDLIAKKA
jgi:hypothetical protein